jgi:hypothetical protein
MDAYIWKGTARGADGHHHAAPREESGEGARHYFRGPVIVGKDFLEI